jgi:hypothetical protein
MADNENVHRTPAQMYSRGASPVLSAARDKISLFTVNVAHVDVAVSDICAAVSAVVAAVSSLNNS